MKTNKKAISNIIDATLDPNPTDKVGYWSVPVSISENHFIYKSLSNWACNLSVGCGHGCLVCYVPSTTTNKLAPMLALHGVQDPDAQWGDYVLLRPWDEAKYMSSLMKANQTPRHGLKPDGNRAVMFCSTTDPYQVIHHPDPAFQRELTIHARFIVRRALELIRDHSSLNVRILTRSPLAQADFELFRSFGKRLLFGMSLPTLRNDLAKVYEPKAPSPSKRLAALQTAKKAGLHVYVALAATYPECDESDLRRTLQAIADLEPLTIFHEPINIRAKNVARIQAHARVLGLDLNTEVFTTRETWMQYAIDSLRRVEHLARELKVSERLHLWPDSTLGSARALQLSDHPAQQLKWLNHWWQRISEWPK